LGTESAAGAGGSGGGGGLGADCWPAASDAVVKNSAETRLATEPAFMGWLVLYQLHVPAHLTDEKDDKSNDKEYEKDSRRHSGLENPFNQFAARHCDDRQEHRYQPNIT
jgi:hypothetical protein